MSKNVHSYILSDIFKLYESYELDFVLKENLDWYAKFIDIKGKEKESKYLKIKLEDSKNILENCLIEKQIQSLNSLNIDDVIKIKKIDLKILKAYFFILYDFIITKDIIIIKSQNPPTLLKEPTTIPIKYIDNKSKFKQNN